MNPVSSALWPRLVAEFIKREPFDVGSSGFLAPEVDRVGLIRHGLAGRQGNDRMTAVGLMSHLPVGELQQLFPELMQLARSAHGPIGAVWERICSLPRAWVLARIDAEVAAILEAEEWDDYWLMLQLLDRLDPQRALALARRAAAHPDPEVRELSVDYPEESSQNGVHEAAGAKPEAQPLP